MVCSDIYIYICSIPSILSLFIAKSIDCAKIHGPDQLSLLELVNLIERMQTIISPEMDYFFNYLIENINGNMMAKLNLSEEDHSVIFNYTCRP